ncbi:MAG UNVERIFIED_CONTAM: hypothetical protein LVR18_33025 [Planctomycetaceae bacterium]
MNTLFRLSIAYGMNDDLKSARRALNEALRMVPNEPQLLARLALIEAEEGRFEQAEAILIQAIGALEQMGNQEQLIETRIRLAGIYFMMQRWDSAGRAVSGGSGDGGPAETCAKAGPHGAFQRVDSEWRDGEG